MNFMALYSRENVLLLRLIPREDKEDREGKGNVIRLELFLESGYSYLARCVDVSWRFRMTKRRAKHVGRNSMKA